MKEPRRLLQNEQASPLLRDALRALEQRGPSPAALERMRAALPTAGGGMPAADGGASTTGLAASGGASLSHTILLGLAITGALTLPGVDRLQHSATPPVSTQPRTAPASPPEIQPPAPTSDSEAPPIAPAPRRSRKRPPVEREPAPTPTAAPSPSLLEPEPEPEPEPAPTPPPPTAAPPPTPEPPPPAATPKPPPKLDPQDEASLLYRAKRLAGSDPGGALRLLAAHADSFPNGALAEEREMLTIQLHRKLGNSDAAQRAAAEFRARHPHSVYLRNVAP